MGGVTFTVHAYAPTYGASSTTGLMEIVAADDHIGTSLPLGFRRSNVVFSHDLKFVVWWCSALANNASEPMYGR